ncbi:MerR family transcriptional regulator [Nemorincola caseinilytica]|uniref:MerR family transcriptional regulator n=1 Tax=Nemorincola caseinilytica TaxID=2054315 RepID=A0ABP8NPN4_9BACT
MGAYQINDLERLTGIKAHTIRIWEKRYGLIRPYRTDTNRRYYDDDQVRKLLNVTTLLSYGHKISKIAALNDEEIYKNIENGAPDRNNVHAHTGYVNDLVTSMLSYDEQGFERIFSAAVLRMGLYDAMVMVVYPFLVKVGVLWSINKTAPIQEHFASCIVRRKLMAAIDGLLAPAKRDKKFLLFLPPDEWHEIGLLFANYMLRAHGFETVYLGQSVPLADLEKVVEGVRPHAIFTLFIAPRPEKEIRMLLGEYAVHNGTAVYFSGDTDLLQHISDLPPNVHRLKDVLSMAETLELL